MPEEFNVFVKKSNYQFIKGSLVAVEESNEPVCLGFKGDVPCKKADEKVIDNGILVSLYR